MRIMNIDYMMVVNAIHMYVWLVPDDSSSTCSITSDMQHMS